MRNLQENNFVNKKEEILTFLSENVFDPILDSPIASTKLKQGVRLTVTRLNQRDPKEIIHYYWSAIVGTERSVKFARMMKEEGFTRFEEIIDEFRTRFNDDWLSS